MDAVDRATHKELDFLLSYIDFPIRVSAGTPLTGFSSYILLFYHQMIATKIGWPLVTQMQRGHWFSYAFEKTFERELCDNDVENSDSDDDDDYNDMPPLEYFDGRRNRDEED